MGLFSRKKKEKPSDRAFELNRNKIESRIARVRNDIFDDRSSDAHLHLVTLIEDMRSLELLSLANPKDISLETYHYNRGRIDGLSNILKIRDTIIADIKNEKAKDGKKTSDNKKTRSYARPTRVSQASLSM